MLAPRFKTAAQRPCSQRVGCRAALKVRGDRWLCHLFYCIFSLKMAIAWTINWLPALCCHHNSCHYSPLSPRWYQSRRFTKIVIPVPPSNAALLIARRLVSFPSTIASATGDPQSHSPFITSPSPSPRCVLVGPSLSPKTSSYLNAAPGADSGE